MKKKDESEKLDELVKTYENRGTEFLGIVKEMNYNVMAPYIEMKKGGTVLELGCGEGDSTRLFAASFHKVVVREGSQEFLNRAQKNLKAFKNIEFSYGLFEDISDIEQYDMIIANYIFEHIQNVQEIFNICYLALKNNGLLFITVPNAKALSRQLAVKMGLLDNIYALTENDLKHGHRRVFDMELLKREAEQTPFVVEKSGGVYVKEFADFQLKVMLEHDIIGREHFMGMQELAKDYPEIAGSIWMCLRKTVLGEADE